MTMLRAIIVEDSDDDTELLRRELVRGGFELVFERVQTAPDLEAAIRHGEWDIIFSDWTMPQFSAPRALEVVKQQELDIPFIIVSGTIGEDVAVEALRSGANDFFPKNRLTLLVPAVERELREAALRRERAQMQEQLVISDRMASIGILAAGIAHEINNPLTAVIGNLDLAIRAFAELKTSDGPDGRRLGEISALRAVEDEVRHAHEGAQRIRNVVRDVKLFARSGSEEHAAVDVRRVVDSSLRMAGNEIRHRAQLRTDFAPVPLVEANESRLGQVVLNLIMNAAQSIPEGRATDNAISIATMVAEDGRVVVEVRDSGAGMSPEVKKSLFMPFFTTKPVGVGTGLGLSICLRIISSMGGSITVDSELGRGSTFRVYLVPARDVTKSADVAEVVVRSPSRRGAVLVIDDEPAVGLLVEMVLSDHEVTTTTNALDALEWVTQGRRFDVILCDLMMPSLTGMEFYAELTRIAPELGPRVVFLTGGAFTPRAEQFLAEVDNLRIDKPFDLDVLTAAVNDRM
jgi:signal transduction histidine kinase